MNCHKANVMITKKGHVIFTLLSMEKLYMLNIKASPRKLFWGKRGGDFVKSWISCPIKYSDLSEGATKTK